jgi:transcriptional regulator with XRE-family HTH domain
VAYARASLARKIAKARRQAGLTQAELARCTHVAHRLTDQANEARPDARPRRRRR